MKKIYRQYTDDQLMLSDNYGKRVSAMTSEALHSKSDIAAELAIRDDEISELKAKIAKLQANINNIREIATEAQEALGFLSHHLRGRIGEATLMDMAEKADALKDALKATPEQCFAEHYANVSQKAFIAGVNATGQGYNGEHGLSQGGIIELADLYVARKIINQASK